MTAARSKKGYLFIFKTAGNSRSQPHENQPVGLKCLVLRLAPMLGRLPVLTETKGSAVREMARTRISVIDVRLATMAVSIGLATALTNPFLTIFLTQQVKTSPSGLALFVILSALSALIFSTLFGWLSDLHSIRHMLLILGAVGGCSGYGLFAILRSFWPLLLVSVSLAAFGTILIPQIFASARAAQDWSDSGRAAQKIANMRMLFAISWVAGPPLGAVLIRSAGFGSLFALVAGTYAVVILTALPSLGPIDQSSAPPDSKQPSKAHAKVTLVTAAFVALQTANAVGVLALPLLLTKDLGANTGTVGLIFGLAAAIEIPLMFMLGAFAKRFDSRIIVIIGALAGVAYYVLVAASASYREIAGAQILAALFVSATMAIGISFFQELIPGRSGFTTSLYSNTTKVSSMLAGPFIGLAEQLGYRVAFLAAAVLCATGASLLAVIRHEPQDSRVVEIS